MNKHRPNTPPELHLRHRARRKLYFFSLRSLLPILVATSFPAFSHAQANPKLTVDEDCPAFAFAPDGRIAYAVRHLISTKHYDLQRDDIWTVTLDGKKKRIVNGEKLVKSPPGYRGPVLFSYAIQSLAWSPDGKRLTVGMMTSQVIDERGNKQEGSLTDLMDESGKEINIEGTHNSVIPEGTQATWLADGVTVVYLTEAVKPKLLYAINAVRPVAGRGSRLFEKHGFVAVAWLAKENAAVAIERDPNLSQPPRLVWLDLLKEIRREVAELDGFLGHLTVSPSGTKVAYFRDHENLEIRELAQPDRVTRVQMLFGKYEWARDERRLLLKRAPDRHSGDLVWISLPDGKLEPVLHSLTFHDFGISPDGQWLAVTLPGKRTLNLYPVP